MSVPGWDGTTPLFQTNEYPWMALLRVKGTSQSSFFCGGALVNDRWVQ